MSLSATRNPRIVTSGCLPPICRADQARTAARRSVPRPDLGAADAPRCKEGRECRSAASAAPVARRHTTCFGSGRGDRGTMITPSDCLIILFAVLALGAYLLWITERLPRIRLMI